MNYNINYINGGSLYKNKDIICIYPLAPKEVVNQFIDISNKIFVCVSNNPLYSVNYYNLPEESIIYCSFYEQENITKEILDELKSKKIKIICVCSTLNKRYLKGNYELLNKKIDLSKYDNISILSLITTDIINSELTKIDYKYQPTTGFSMLMDVNHQNPNKIYIFGYSFFVPKFQITNNYKSKTDNVTHSFRKEFQILKPYLMKENVIKDEMINYVIDHEDEIPQDR